jgi:hypothetical protein
MSANERPDARAVRELEVLVRNLVDELAAFRKRALTAEGKLKEIASTEGGAQGVEAITRAAELATENAHLRKQLDTARTRASGVLTQVKFLRQQAQGGEK